MLLLRMKLHQSYNNLFRFSPWGKLLLVSELISFTVLIVLALKQGAAGSTLLLAAGIAVLIGNSYISGEKYLFTKENRLDLLSGVDNKTIILASFWQTIAANLHISSLLPFIWLLMAGELAVLLLWPLLLTATATTALAISILCHRFARAWAGLCYTVMSVVLTGSLTAAIYLIFRPVNIPLAWSSIIWCSCLCLLIIFFAYRSLSFLSDCWQRSYISFTLGQNKIVSFTTSRILHKSFGAVTAKELLLLMRNPLTKFRLLFWLICLLLCYITPINSYLQTSNGLLLVTFIIWLICFAELPATAFQNEGKRLLLPKLAGHGRGYLLINKIMAYLFLAVIAALTVCVLALAVKPLTFKIFYPLAAAFFLSSAAIIIAILLSSCGGKQENPASKANIILEQVPLTKSSVLALLTEILVLATYFFISYTPNF